MSELGVRELRADLPAAIRRAAAGERITITVNGRPAAMIAPLGTPFERGAPDMDALVAAGSLVPARRADHVVPDGAVTVWRNVRLDLLLREIRG